MAQIVIGIAIIAAEAGISYALRKKMPTAPPMQDLQVSSAANGALIPFGFGLARFGGQVIWSPGIQYNRYPIPGKGGPANFGYTYFASVAVAFGEGPGTIQRIWADSKLIYKGGVSYGTYTAWDPTVSYVPDDLVAAATGPGAGHLYQCLIANKNVPQFGSSYYWADVTAQYPDWGPTQTYVPGQLVRRSNQIWACIYPTKNNDPIGGGGSSYWQILSNYYGVPTIYPGTQTQNPDPAIQANEGAALTPAFRGLNYAVWNPLQLSNFGSRIPQFRAEVLFT